MDQQDMSKSIVPRSCFSDATCGCESIELDIGLAVRLQPDFPMGNYVYGIISTAFLVLIFTQRRGATL